MRFSWLLFVVSIIVSLASAQDEIYLYDSCSSGSNYTSNSIYQKNLQTLLASLSSNNDINYGFYNISEGEGTDRVNAIALCRGDIDESSCLGCLNFSATDLQQKCPAQKEGVIWYDYCMIRYSNQSSIFHSWGQPAMFMWSVKYMADVSWSSQVLAGLLSRLRDQASMGDSHTKFAVGNVEYANFSWIYGLVQCTPDLTQMQCSNCLDNSFIETASIVSGKQGGRGIGPSCNFRYESYQFYYQTSTPPPPPPSPQPPPSPPHPPSATFSVPITVGWKDNIIKLIVGCTLASAALFTAFFVLILLKTRKAKLRNKGQHVLVSTDAHDIISVESLQFDFETIQVATDNFKSDNKLGQGGFGSVYKGKFVEGKEIAVKRLAAHSGQGDTEFTNEVVLVAKLQHRNLVRLLGYCLEGSERLLVYEFVPNSSLDHFLFDPLKRVYLDWERRYKIIGGIAKGLLYLHEDSRLTVIHRDLKAGNVLLDEEMCPKIADFGMARLFIQNQTQGNTTRIVGTYGYMAPEYAMHGKFSVKSDVYSFGILLLEIIIGQKNSRFRMGDKPQELTSFAWENWKAGTAINIVDPTILSGHINDILRCIHIGLLCVQDSVSARPTMASVVLMLSSASQSLRLPSKPAYISSVESEMIITCSSVDKLSTRSVNQVSVSDLLPR